MQENLLEKDFDLFIAYHGTKDDNGSMLKAKEIYDFLKDKIECFFFPEMNESGKFGDTPRIASHSKLFLFVCNGNIELTERKEIPSTRSGLYNEIDAFYNVNFNNKNNHGNARVFAYGGLTSQQANNFHDIFRNVAHFEEKNDGMIDLCNWISTSLNISLSDLQSGFADDFSKQPKAIITAHDFTLKFLHSGAKACLEDPGDVVLSKFSEYCILFKDIFRLKIGNSPIVSADLKNELFSMLDTVKKTDKSVNLLKVKGPLGSYKNRLFQFFYLYIYKTSQTILPVYIDLSVYEKVQLDNISHNTVADYIVEDFKKLRDVLDNTDKIPLIILDGIRDFSCGKNEMYEALANEISSVNAYFIFSLDTDFTENSHHKFRIHPLVPVDCKYFLRIYSMQLYKKEESLQFLRKCIDIGEISFFKDYDVNNLYNRLIKMNLVSMDAYWIIMLLNKLSDYIVNDEITISDLYAALCNQIIRGKKQILSDAISFAYKFEYLSEDFSDNDFFFNPAWKLVRKHRSMLDYLIARYYVQQFEELDFSLQDRNTVLKKLNFFNMVLPKRITRFVLEIIKGLDDYETKILMIAETYYHDLSVMGKSELTYWLGRLSRNRNHCAELLLGFLSEIKNDCDTCAALDITTKKNKEFLLRNIMVSLIYLGNSDITDEYIERLLYNNLANIINRGFHLEYYGDKKYIPNQTILDFEDALEKGENTFNMLCISIEKRLKENKYCDSTLLSLFTLCSLMQARAEKTDGKIFDTFPYVGRCKKYLAVFMRRYSNRIGVHIKRYFNWMIEELNGIPDGAPFKHRKDGVYKNFSAACKVKRTGWVNFNIPEPENIVEHMYNCWLIGLLYLPESLPDSSYSKEKILQMLLMHDLAETNTGDISRPEKVKNQQYYDDRENDIMHNLFLEGTYPSVCQLSKYSDMWDEWFARKDINSQIAKDIDNIQAIYQFCVYYLKMPDLFTLDDLMQWLDGTNEIMTDVGRSICSVLVENNIDFSPIIAKWRQGDIL